MRFGGAGGIRITMIPSFLANYIKNRPFWYVKPPLLASVSPTIPLLMTTIVVKTVVRSILSYHFQFYNLTEFIVQHLLHMLTIISIVCNTFYHSKYLILKDANCQKEGGLILSFVVL